MNEEKRKSTALRLLQEHLKARSLRSSPERRALLDKVLQQKTSFTVATIEEAMKDDGFRVSRATIYNNLHLFEEAGIVTSFDGTWELRVDSGVSMTLVCSRCGRRRQLKDAALFRELAARRYPSFSAVNVNIIVKGICQRCRKNA
ncbi:MAG: transcriptional repressor [Muribaculaceae bacterium]|nr:transcriptional repressor [Muribaculaceae bacterium]